MDNRFEKCPDCNNDTNNKIGKCIVCDVCKKVIFPGLGNRERIIREVDTYVDKVEAWYAANKVSNFIQQCNNKKKLSNSEKDMLDCIRTGQSLLVELKNWCATPSYLGDCRFERLLYDVASWDKQWQNLSNELKMWKIEELQ